MPDNCYGPFLRGWGQKYFINNYVSQLFRLIRGCQFQLTYTFKFQTAAILFQRGNNITQFFIRFSKLIAQ
jgi:hypothetical protein